VSSDQCGRRYLTIMVVPDGGQETHTVRVAYRTLRAIGLLGVVAALAMTLVAGSWWYLAARSARVTTLEGRVQELTAERQRIDELATQIDAIESGYDKIRDLFGPGTAAPSEVWLPPSSASARGGGTKSAAATTLPTSWPLTDKGFVTRGLLDENRGGDEHPGLDIAVPTDSYIRAAGAGTVTEVGDDPIYGRFVVIEHGNGYTTLYGHASMQLVTTGQRVRQNEVIALSGSTGRSTAPHLHFEILLNGEAVDPLSLVQQP
jgi:murein DD-endopeptidase MepM/ murein hydrolase activator NlpD